MHPTYQSVLITGSSSGFGLLAAVALAKAGYRVYATMRNLDKQDRLLAQCQKAGTTVAVRRLDVVCPETIGPVVAEIQAQCQGPDVLINNAGFAFSSFFEDTSQANFEEQLATNFYGALHCTRAVLPGMRSRGQGLILNISSISGLSPTPGLSAYCASKFALEGWSEALRYEVKPFGIFVVLLEPGTFKTEIFAATKKGDGSQDPASPYAALLETMEKNFHRDLEKYGQDPQRVVRKIIQIVRARRPKIRYTVGTDAALESFLKRLLPISWFEKLMAGLICGRYMKK